MNKYEVKLKYLLGKYDVWEHAANPLLLSRIAGVLVDPRFRPDHHHVKGYGSAPPALVHFVRVAHAYLAKCAEVLKVKEALDVIESGIKHLLSKGEQAVEERHCAEEQFEHKRLKLEEQERLGHRANVQRQAAIRNIPLAV